MTIERRFPCQFSCVRSVTQQVGGPMKARALGTSVTLTIGAALAVVAVLLGAAAANAGGWVAHGPGGGVVKALAVDPSTPGRLYAATGPGRVYRTDDAASTWGRRNSGLPTAAFGAPAMAVVPASPGTLYVSTNPSSASASVFRSTNGGASWSNASTGLPSANVFSLAADPTSASTAYAG